MNLPFFGLKDVFHKYIVMRAEKVSRKNSTFYKSFYKCDSFCVTFIICHMLSQIIRKRWQTIELEKIVDKTHGK